jgi:hypothetical protein
MWDDLTSEAEDGLIEAVRAPKAGDFTLTIACEARRWHVRYASSFAGKVKNGYGLSFDEAWKDMMMPASTPGRAKQPRHRNIVSR